MLMKLVEENIDLVKHMADVMRRKSGIPAKVSLDDLIGYGYFGLIDAAKTYDNKREVTFKSYAMQKIKWAILDGLRKMDHVTRAHRQDIKAGIADDVIIINFSEMEDDDKSIENILEDRSLTINADTLENIQLAMKRVRNVERKILTKYYFEDKTMLKISKELNVSESRICQIHRQAIEFLRKEL